MAICLACLSLWIFVAISSTIAILHFLRKLKLPNIENRPVFITGCDSGFGKSLTLRLIGEKIPVFAGCLTETSRKDLEKEAGENLKYLKTLILDVTDDQSVKESVEIVKNGLDGKKLWAVVNNAGILLYEGAAEWIPIESYKKTIDVNTYGIIRVCNAFLPLLRESKGRIVTVISCAGRLATSPLTTYSVSKYAAEAYIDCLRREVCHFGISCHILEPGVYKTSIVLTKTRFPHSRNAFDNLPEEVKQIYGENYLKQMDERFYQILEAKANPRIEEVVEAYYHAITSKFPKLRYAVGLDAKLVYVPASFLPTWIQDLIISVMNLDPVPDFVKKNKNE